MNRHDLLLDTEVSGLDQAGVMAVLHSAGDVIREIRIERGLLQVDVAHGCGVTGSTLCRIERGHRGSGLSFWLGVCAVLGVRLSAVLRMAEDDAFPIEPLPWRYDPAVLLSHRSRQVPHDSAVDSPTGFLRGDFYSGS